MVTIETIGQMAESTKAALAQVETQKAAIITNTQGAEDEAALIEWATLDTRARFLARYLEHLEGPASQQAKTEKIADIRAEFAQLYPQHLDLLRAMNEAGDNYAKLRGMIRMSSNEHLFTERAQAVETTGAAYSASQKRLLALRDEITALGGVVELPI